MRPVSRSIRALRAPCCSRRPPFFSLPAAGSAVRVLRRRNRRDRDQHGRHLGFGSVVMNGVHYRTDNNVAPGFKTKKMVNGKDNSGRPDSDVFAVGMIVTVRHGVADNNALVIEYRDNLQGPVAKLIPGTDNVLEFSGSPSSWERGDLRLPQAERRRGSQRYADNAGRIRASRIFSCLPRCLPLPGVRSQRVRLRVVLSDGLSAGPLPDGSGVTVAVSYDAAAIAGLSGDWTTGSSSR